MGGRGRKGGVTSALIALWHWKDIFGEVVIARWALFKGRIPCHGQGGYFSRLTQTTIALGDRFFSLAGRSCDAYGNRES